MATIPVNSLIIPMDTTYQNTGMFKAYGLVYRLLKNGIPVIWSIAPGKAFDGTDFVASATDFQTSASIVAHSYTGGPFIIDASNAAAATPIITAWQASNVTTVHKVTASFVAPVFALLTKAPRIAVEDTNNSIVRNYLNTAGIPDSLGNVWVAASPDVLDATEIAGGALFDSTNQCNRRAYDMFMSPHTSDSTWTLPAAVANLDKFVQVGGHVHSMCHSISAIENVFFFLTTTGIPGPWNKGDKNTFTVDHPDYGLDQAVSTTNPQELPGGSEQTWLRSAVTYRPTSRTMAHFLDNSTQYDFMASGVYKGGTGAGRVNYEGGHSYSVSLPYLGNMEAVYVRFVLDSIMMAAAVPSIDVVVTPSPAPAGIPGVFTVTVVNNGGSPAQNFNISITLDPGVVLVPGSDVPPATVALPPTYSWTIPSALPGQVITFNVNAVPLLIGENKFLTYTATYSDVFLGDNYTLAQCSSIQAVAGAAPSVDKLPPVGAAYPNQNFVWTINTANNGPLALLNPVLVDTLPAGLTFVGSVPVPNAIAPGPGGTTLLTYNLANIPALSPGPTITITVLTPPATTAAFVDTATLTGTDINGIPYTVADTAQLDVTDRAPVVTVTYPNGGELESGIVPITWTASDPDGDPLTYDVFYSPDNGTTWVQIGDDINTTSFNWNSFPLNGDQFLVKVVASDSLLTGEDTSDATFSIDNTPPTVHIILPIEGSTICGTVALTALAQDDFGIKRVEFYYSLDNGVTWVAIGNATVGPPYIQNFESTDVPDGPILIKAVAVDNVDLTAEDVVQYVVDNTPPTAAIVSPPDLSTVSGVVTIVGSASDNIGVTKVEWYIDDVLVAIDPVAPYEFVWNTLAFTEGTHIVKIKAYDGCNNSAEATAAYLVDNIPDHAVEVGIDSTIVIPPQKPPAVELRGHLIKVIVEKVKVIATSHGTKILVIGEVHITVKYVSDAEDQQLHAVQVTVPFETLILWADLPLGAEVKVMTIVESQDFYLIDPRHIGKFIVLLVTVEAV